jgi:hypothetical protein
MSTPSGKLGNPIDLSAYEPRMARQLSATERRLTEDETDPLRSAYAPKRAHDPAGTPVEKDRDALRSPYAPKKPYALRQARGQPAAAADFVISNDAEPAREAPRERPAAARHFFGGGAHALVRPFSNDRDDHSPKTVIDEGFTRRHPVDGDAVASFQPALASGGRHQPPAAERHDEITNDPDLRRLEASLPWLRRQEAATRLPRATPLPPVPGLAPVDATGPRHSSEMLVDSIRPPRSLEPERLTPPLAVRSRRDNRRWPLAIVMSGIIAVPIAYYFSVGGRGLPAQLGPQIASFDQTIGAPPSKGTQKYRPTSAQDHDHKTAPMEMSADRTGISQTARSSEGETVAMLQGRSIGAQAPSTGKANRALDPEEIKLLTRQGEQFAAAGDLVTARILFQRAAEAGDATAAMALGATYDPNALAKLGVVGMGADVEKARSWYRKAESFGSPEASRRLNALAIR